MIRKIISATAALLITSVLCHADDTKLNEAVKLSQKGDHEASEKVMKEVKDTNTPRYDFFRLVNNYSLNNRREALKWADNVLYGFGSNGSTPARYYDLAIILKADLETWKHDPNDLDDIAREMNKATSRLRNSQGGPKTQKIQKDVAERLKQLISKLEDDKNAAAKAQQDAEEKQKEELRKQLGLDKPSPPPEAPSGQDRGTGQVDIRKVKEIAAVWGKLPEKERARAMRELTANLPPQDKLVVERYLKELQRRSKNH